MDDGDEFGRVDRVAGREDAAWEETELEELCDRFVLGGPANQTLLMMIANDKPETLQMSTFQIHLADLLRNQASFS